MTVAEAPSGRREASSALPPVAFPLAVVCGALALLLWPVFFGHQTLFFRDLCEQYIGTGRILHLGKGVASLLWDPFVNGGQPLLGNPNRFIVYPSRILYRIFDPASALNFEIALHLLLGGTGSVLLVRRLGASGAASAVTGLAYSLSGLSISITNHLGRLMAYHWIPWVLLAVHAGLCENGRNSGRWRGLVPVLFMLQWLTGTAEIAAITAVIAVGWVAALRPRDGRTLRALAHSAGLVALGMAMAAVQILPAAEMVYRSDRTSYAQTRASTQWSLHPLRLPELVVPGYCGPIDVVDFDSHYWGAGLIDHHFPLILNLYLGAAVVVLAAVGWMRSGRDPVWSPLRRLFALFAGGAMLLAFGKYLPFIGEVWTAIPGLNVLRYPVKALLVVGLPVAIMAGRGTDRWLKTEERTAVRWWTVVLAMAALSLVIGVWISRGWSAPILDLVFLGRGELAAAGLPGRFVHVALVLGILAVIGFASGRVRKRMALMLVVTIVTTDLIVALAPYLPMAPRGLLDDTPKMVGEIRRELSGGRLFRDQDPEDFEIPRVENRVWEWADWRLQVVARSVAATFLLPTIFQLDIADLADRRVARLRRAVGEVDWPERLKLFQVAAVEVVVTPEASRVPGLELVKAFFIEERLMLFMNRVTPRPKMVRWVGGWREAGSAQEALGTLVTPNFDPSIEAVREIDPPTTRARSPFLMPFHPKSEVWTEVITAPMSGFVVTAVPWHPDLMVRVDGRVVRAERANYAFLGFEIPPGRREIQIIFVPRTVFVGVLVSAASTVIWVVLVVAMWWSGRDEGLTVQPSRRE